MRDVAGAHAAPILTPRQRQILEFVIRFRRERGYSPSVREIGEHFGIRSPNGVACHLKALRRKGALSSSAGKSRTLRPASGLKLPFGGEVG